MLPRPMRFGGLGIGLVYGTVPHSVVRFTIARGTCDFVEFLYCSAHREMWVLLVCRDEATSPLRLKRR